MFNQFYQYNLSVTVLYKILQDFPLRRQHCVYNMISNIPMSKKISRLYPAINGNDIILLCKVCFV